jgi:hypothetical protein
MEKVKIREIKKLIEKAINLQEEIIDGKIIDIDNEDFISKLERK